MLMSSSDGKMRERIKAFKFREPRPRLQQSARASSASGPANTAPHRESVEARSHNQRTADHDVDYKALYEKAIREKVELVKENKDLKLKADFYDRFQQAKYPYPGYNAFQPAVPFPSQPSMSFSHSESNYGSLDIDQDLQGMFPPEPKYDFDPSNFNMFSD
jgi:hypothetical protein